jgi:hypothetical protein
MKTKPGISAPGQPEFVASKSRFLRRRRILKAVRDVESGAKDTEARGVPNDVPAEPQHPVRRRRV